MFLKIIGLLLKDIDSSVTKQNKKTLLGQTLVHIITKIISTWCYSKQLLLLFIEITIW
jgi:hypothetical protein